LIAAAVGGLVLLFQTPIARAQSAPPSGARLATLASGSISGVVQDERGAPIAGAMVSALGARTSIAVTDRAGRFEFRTLSPGPYLLRAHVRGFDASRGQLVEVRASARTTSSISLNAARTSPAGEPPAAEPNLPVLVAGLGGATQSGEAVQPVDATAGQTEAAPPGDLSPEGTAESPAEDDHSETAWRIRHLRRSILKDVTVPHELFGDEVEPGGGGVFAALAVRSTGSNGLAASLFAGVPLTGQFDFLTTGSFDSPKQLFSSDNFSRSIASVSLAAPVGAHADWSMRGALTQGDISSWFVSGAYATRVPARHRYDLGLSYSTQRYDGGNPAALREVTDGSRNVGAVYGFDTFTIAPALAITYGARFSRYDYLDAPGLLSPRLEVAVSPLEHFRLSALVSSRALAPGEEEFLPPLDAGLWLPPQRTFSSIVEGHPLGRERTDHLAVAAERDFGASTVTVRAFRQRVDDQLVTVFGFDAPGSARTELGHYFVGNAGDVEAFGWSAGFRTTLASRVTGSVEYSLTNARWQRSPDAQYLLVVAPSVVRPSQDRVHDISTTVETSLPETSTRILVMARLSSAPPANGERTTYDPRFDVQVHQSLPFMDFSAARWEMLVAVRNSFHEPAVDASVFDELLVVRPPKRLVGGLTVRF
jgi:hypothetical protein